jgi:hypothetical protein
MTKTEITGSIKSGVIQLNNFTRKRLQDDLRQFEDCDIQIVIKKRGKRSSQANRYYWGCIIQEIRTAFRERGTIATPEEIHEALKAKFNPNNLIDENGTVLLEMGGSTTNMNTGEFSEYVDRVIQWAAQYLQLVIPAPGTQTEIPFLLASYDEEARATIIKKAS